MTVGELHTVDAHQEVDGVPLSFIGLDDFKQNKRATGRLKDLADLDALDDKS